MPRPEGMKSSACKGQRKSILGKGHSMCKVLEVGMRLECGRNEGRPGRQKHREQDWDWQEKSWKLVCDQMRKSLDFILRIIG